MLFIEILFGAACDTGLPDDNGADLAGPEDKADGTAGIPNPMYGSWEKNAD